MLIKKRGNWKGPLDLAIAEKIPKLGAGDSHKKARKQDGR